MADGRPPVDATRQRDELPLFRSKRRDSQAGLISVADLKKRLDEGQDFVLLDVRKPSDFDDAPADIPTSVRMLPAELPERFTEITRGKPVVLYCA
ncbi:MAG: rhodanese-like domain-containing protein [Chloroflexota bacterium]